MVSISGAPASEVLSRKPQNPRLHTGSPVSGLQITHPPPYLYGLVILVAALELLALPPVELETASGADAVSAYEIALHLNSRNYQMYSSSWTTATRLVLATLMLMLAPAMALASQDNPGVQRVDMDLGDYQFHPKTVSIATGTAAELILTNRDSITPHSFIVEAPEAGMEMNLDVPAGESATIVLRPTRPGTYTFYCDKKFLFFASHREKGMEGQIEVTAGSG